MSAKCFNCGSPFLRKIRPYAYLGSGKHFETLFPSLDLLHCSRCSLSQVDHEQIESSKLTRYYQMDYRGMKDSPFAENSVKRGSLAQSRSKGLLNLLFKEVKNPEKVLNIFEFGAGPGQNLIAFSNVFPNAKLYTNEIDTFVDLPEKIYTEIPEDIEFDIILISHVFEHLLYPQDAIRPFVEKLKSGGFLLIEVPNDHREILATRSLDEPHVSFFTMYSIDKLFQKHFHKELKKVKLVTSGGLFNVESLAKINRKVALKQTIKKCLSNFTKLPSSPTGSTEKKTVAEHESKNDKKQLSPDSEHYKAYEQNDSRDRRHDLRILLKKI